MALNDSDNQILIDHLSNTLSNNNAVRLNSEKFLLNLINSNPSITENFLLLTTNNNINFGIKLIALTIVKNNIKKFWFINDSISNNNNLLKNQQISNEIKSKIKELIKHVLVNFEDPIKNNLLLNQYLNIIEIILKFDVNFDNDLLSISSDLMESNLNDFDKQFVSISIVFQIAKSYRYTFNENIDKICHKFLPLYYSILNENLSNLNDLSGNSNEMFLIFYKIVKIMNYLISFKIPDYFFIENNFENWINLLLKLIKINNSIDNEFFLKSQKWSFAFFYRILIKHSKVSNNLYSTEIIDILNNQVLPYILNNYMKLINDESSIIKNEISNFYFVSFISESIETHFTIIEPVLNNMILKLIIPNLSMNEESIEEFNYEPVEFINTYLSLSSIPNSNFSEFDYNYKNSETSSKKFLIKLLKFNGFYIDPIKNLIIEILNSSNYNSIVFCLKTLSSTWKFFEIDDLHLILNKILVIESTVVDKDWLSVFVYEFLSNININKLILDADATNNNDTNTDTSTSTNIKLLINNLLNKLNTNLDNNSSSLPLIISSIKLVVTIQNNVIDIRKIMEILINLNSNFEIEILPELIDFIVLNYSKELEPFSINLIEGFKNQFLKIIENNIDNNNNIENENEIENQLLSILNNLITIILSLTNSKLIDSILDILSPVMSIVLNNGYLNLLSESIELLETCNFISKKINLSNLIEVSESFQNFGFNYFDYYETFFENVYIYGDNNSKLLVTEILNWCFNENLIKIGQQDKDNDDESDNEAEDAEMFSWLIKLSSKMVLSDNSDLSDEILIKILKLNYNFSEKIGNKNFIRLIVGSFWKKNSVIINELDTENFKKILIKLNNLIELGKWSTVFDLKIGILGLLELLKNNNFEGEIAEAIGKLLTIMVSKIGDAIDHRVYLLKLENNEIEEDSHVEIDFDDEFDELNKDTVVDEINVVNEFQKYINSI